MSQTFSDRDLEEPEGLRSLRREARVGRASTVVAILCLALILGGTTALGAAAAPSVMNHVIQPFAGDAMARAFAAWDRVMLGASAVLMGAELVRAFISRRSPQVMIDRVRRWLAMLITGLVTWLAMSLTPAITRLHERGAVMGEGDLGLELASVHHTAEAVGKALVLLSAIAIALYVVTTRSLADLELLRDSRADEPLPPGAR